MPGTVTVVNMHHLPGRTLPDASYVYIGRPKAGGSLGLGNPITLEDYQNDRAAVLEAYQAYAREAWTDPKSPLRGLVEDLARRVQAGEDLKLACWCAPKACHGDVLKSAIERLVRRPAPPAPSAGSRRSTP